MPGEDVGDGAAGSATDAQGDSISYAVNQPAHGGVTLAGNKATYTPNTNFIGTDTFTFTASDYGLTSAAATVTIVVSPPPTADLLVKNKATENYIGDEIVSLDGTNQAVNQFVVSGGKAVYHVVIQPEDVEESLLVKVSAPGGTNGWTVRYFDASEEGEDVTDLVTGTEGWKPVVDEEAFLRIEVTSPEGMTADASLELLIKGAPENDDIHGDAVKVVTASGPSLQPDISFLEVSDGTVWPVPSFQWVGRGTFGSDATAQSLALFSGGWVRYARLELKNAGTIAGDFKLKGDTAQNGWSVTYHEPNGDDITAAVVAGTYEIHLAAGQARVLTVKTGELTLDTGAGSEMAFKATGGNSERWVDTGQVKMGAQSLAGIEYSLDNGDSWQVFTGQLTVTRLAVVGFRGKKTVSNQDWRLGPVYQPLWTHGATRPGGETVFLQYKTLGQQSVSVRCGNTIAGVVNVIAEP